ncbi:MAG: NAD(P)H-dependent oxidoreductase [Rhodospirillaceae bacterium]|nr:NAD(P)H-dependent oxidoreductase [Rhodospirillaceae bacterium]
MKKIDVRTGMPSVQRSRAAFAARLRERFYDPAFDAVDRDIERIIETAWNAYEESRKSPRTRRAGRDFADPDYELSIEWLEARRQIRAAEREQKNRRAPSRILIVNGSARSDQTCPGEISKTWRLATMACDLVRRQRGFEVELLDLSRLTSEFGRQLHSCKACVSTAMPLCHWPCSCYPIMHSVRPTTGWPRSIRNGLPHTA